MNSLDFINNQIEFQKLCIKNLKEEKLVFPPQLNLHYDFLEKYEQIKKDLERLKQFEEENQDLKNKYEKLKRKYSNIRKYPAINQALMNYDEIDWEILKDEYGEEVFGNDK